MFTCHLMSSYRTIPSVHVGQAPWFTGKADLAVKHENRLMAKEVAVE